ncbi:MAG: cell division protein FtsL [Clostridium sp.]|uniref:cell division protein FtsL n=1 Tax=Clostridium sp. TaxID=1506 RepID=UPI0025B90FED|nr:cell division protein FtsL [Clostridium sp.]MCE5221448.1 cell division protein FtsL [Clostridium sp.]
MNKLAGREYDYIKGSTVSAPERKSGVRKLDKKYKKIQRRKNINNRNTLLRNRRKNDRKYVLTMVVIIFGLGFLTISGDGKVYDMQRKISNLGTQINQTQEDNEALKVKLLKYSALSNIQGKAETKLSMFIPNKKETVRIDFSQNYFEDLKSNSSSNNTKETLLSKVMNLIK